MAFVNGHTGDITIGGTAVRVKKWGGKLSQDEIDTTRKGDGGWRTFTTGLKHMEGSFEYDMDVAIHATGTFPVPFGSTPATFALSMSDGTNNGGSFGFSGYVFDLDFSSDVAGIITVTGSYKSSGAVTYTAGS